MALWMLQLLWYEELKTALLNLHFQISPLDPCLFVLPRRDGTGIHGIVGIHVDDGLGAGDEVFEHAISQLETRYPFGSKKSKEFIFTGIHISQQWDGSIEMDQTQYIEDIPAIDIDRSRRQRPDEPVTAEEKQALRGLIGSIQYAATNTRPDLSAKLSLLQAKINCATIKDLSEANRLLQEAKQYKDTKIIIKSIPLQDVRFVSFSDASFANRANAQSQKGCLILASSKQIGDWKASDISPLLWYSRKIARDGQQHTCLWDICSQWFSWFALLDPHPLVLAIATERRMEEPRKISLQCTRSLCSGRLQKSLWFDPEDQYSSVSRTSSNVGSP